ncbi:MAG: DUF4403 family protein [Bacteroidota bacterium]
MKQLILFIGIYCLLACNSNKSTINTTTTSGEIEKPVESYTYVEKEIQPSSLNLPIRLPVADIERLINREIQAALEANSTFEQDDLEVQAKQLDDVTIALEGQQLRYNVSLDLKIKKDIGFSVVRADAAIALVFITDFDIAENWELKTVTDLDTYEWKEKPRLQLGPIDVPAQFVGDIVLRRARDLIGTTIDEQLQANFNLRETMQTAWQQLHTPIPLSDEVATWLSIRPTNVAATPIVTKDDAIEMTIAIQGEPKIYIGSLPKEQMRALPAFAFQKVKDNNFQIILNADIPYAAAENLVVSNTKGETFEYNNYSVTVDDITLYGQNKKLVVEALLSGSYDGKVYLTGEPFYNNFRNRIDLNNLEFTLNTTNFLMKSAAWLLKSNLRRRIRDNLDIQVDENLANLRELTKNQLKNLEFAPGIFLQGDLEKMDITDTYLTPDGIRLELGMEGKVELDVDLLNGEK